LQKQDALVKTFLKDAARILRKRTTSSATCIATPPGKGAPS